MPQGVPMPGEHFRHQAAMALFRVGLRAEQSDVSLKLARRERFQNVPLLHQFEERLFVLLPVLRLPVGFANLDRKSTRLNSSHGSISYAVFCLKKNTSI